VNSGRGPRPASPAQHGLLRHLELRLARAEAGDAIGATIERAVDVARYFPDGLGVALADGGSASHAWLGLATTADRHWAERAEWRAALPIPALVARRALLFACAISFPRGMRRLQELAAERDAWGLADDEVARARLRLQLDRAVRSTCLAPPPIQAFMHISAQRDQPHAEFVCEALPICYARGGDGARRAALDALPTWIPSFSAAEPRARLWNVAALAAWRQGAPEEAISCLERAEDARRELDALDPAGRHLRVIFASNRARVESESGRPELAWTRMLDVLGRVAEQPELVGVRWYHLQRAFGIARRAGRLDALVGWVDERVEIQAALAAEHGTSAVDLFQQQDALRVVLALADARFDLGDVPGAVAGYEDGLATLHASGLELPDLAWSLATALLIAKEGTHAVLG
jgi:hypothetical protein